MQYTLGQACRKLSHVTHAYGVTDVREAVNDAVQALAGMSGWECLRHTVRISSASPLFALPQGCAGLVRACVAGRPAVIRGQDFEFLHSGPGDLRAVPHGFSFLAPSSIVDRGLQPVEVHPAPGFRLYAASEGEGEPPLAVKAVDADGNVRKVDVPATGEASFDEISDGPFSSILSVSVDAESAHEYVSLWATWPDGSKLRLGTYNPFVAAPSFRTYEVHGGPCAVRHGSYEMLAEVRIDPLPLVSMSDILPFDSLEPVEWTAQSRWMTRAGEVDAAQKLHALAANWLKAREVANDTVQTSVVFNNLFATSLGEPSMESVNI